jgi:hypothetical protein
MKEGGVDVEMLLDDELPCGADANAEFVRNKIKEANEL